MNLSIFPSKRPPAESSGTTQTLLHSLSAFLDGHKPPEALDTEERALALSLADRLTAWAAEVKDYELSEQLAGRGLPEWKAVPGKSNRRFTDVDAAIGALRENGYDVEQLYERKPLSLAKIESMVGKNDFGRIAGGFVERPLGKPILVPASDPRSPFPTVV